MSGGRKNFKGGSSGLKGINIFKCIKLTTKSIRRTKTNSIAHKIKRKREGEVRSRVIFI